MRLRILMSVMVLGAISCVLVGCVNKYPRHSFSFDTMYDSPDAEVLDYQYGSFRQLGVYADPERIALGQVFGGANTSGRMLRGDFLTVKWRIKTPGKYGEYEDKVDLRNRLPRDMTGLRVHFVIKGPQLYVYLISKELKPANEPTGPVQMYELQKQTQIYPDQSKSSSP